MLSLSAVSKAEKNKLHLDSVYIPLFEIIPNVDGITDNDIIRVCYNNENIVWKKKTFQPFPLELDEVKHDQTGSESNVQLKVSNVTRALQPYIEQYNGGNGYTVIIRVVNTKNLDGEADVEERFTVNQAVCDEQWITFTLGTGYGLNARRPIERYMKNNCPFQYKGLECGYNGRLTSCNHSLKDCRNHGNSRRFGGFPGIDQKGVYYND